MNRSIINFIFFQVGWFACVLSAANGMPLLGAAVAIMIILFHLFQSNDYQKETMLVSAALVIGLIWDSVLVWQGILLYEHGLVHEKAAPYWIILMWGLFATTLNISMNWLKGKTLLAIVFGGIGGPLAYYAGARMGAVEFSDLYIAMGTLAIGWAVLTPLLMKISLKFNGYALERV